MFAKFAVTRGFEAGAQGGCLDFAQGDVDPVDRAACFSLRAIAACGGRAKIGDWIATLTE
jgi:hypothetical protein